ncbi:MAG: hypothetical protein QXI16_01265 [Sulfolobaceae archaeon]
MLLAIFIIVRLKLKSNSNFVVDKFKHANVGVFGKKRKGKDITFQHVIWRRNDFYYSNISYGGQLIKRLLPRDLSLGNNTYENFIQGRVDRIERLLFEKKDIYFSDAGNLFPSQYYKELNKQYPGMALFISLQGHTYDSNTHFNWNGSFHRLYDKAREQLDEYFKVLGSFKVPFFGLLTKVRYFEKAESAELNLLPYKRNSLLDSKQNKSLRQQYHATNGLIKDMFIYTPKKALRYDTRDFEKQVFNENSKRQYIKRDTRFRKFIIASARGRKWGFLQRIPLVANYLKKQKQDNIFYTKIQEKKKK